MSVPSEPAARVTVSRRDPRDVGQRQVYARIDDGPTWLLRFGDVFQADLAPGEHRLRCNNTLFWKRRTFVVRAGEHTEFVLVNRAPRGAFGLLALLGAAPLVLAIEQRHAPAP